MPLRPRFGALSLGTVASLALLSAPCGAQAGPPSNGLVSVEPQSTSPGGASSAPQGPATPAPSGPAPSAARPAPAGTSKGEPREGVTVGFALGAGFGAIRIGKPLLVPVTLRRTTTRGGVTTTTTIENATWPVTVQGKGPAVLGDFRLGYMLAPRIAVLFGFAFTGNLFAVPDPPPVGDGWEIYEQGSSGSSGIPLQVHLGASVQVFVAAPVWLRGGFGFGAVYYDPDTDHTGGEVGSTGPSLLAAVGFEFSRMHSNKAPSIELEFIAGPLGDNAHGYAVTAGIGYQWY